MIPSSVYSYVIKNLKDCLHHKSSPCPRLGAWDGLDIKHGEGGRGLCQQRCDVHLLEETSSTVHTWPHSRVDDYVLVGFHKSHESVPNNTFYLYFNSTNCTNKLSFLSREHAIAATWTALFSSHTPCAREDKHQRTMGEELDVGLVTGQRHGQIRGRGRALHRLIYSGFE